jgi:peptide/nickel transport system permease protein
VLPNVASPLIVQASLALGVALLAEAGLSFLGLGLQPPEASWGSMLQRAHQFIFTDPWQMIVPGLAIASTVLAFNTAGDGLRDALGISSAAQRRASGVLGLTPTLSSATPRAPASTPTEASEALLAVNGLTIELTTSGAPVKVVEDLDLTIARGEILGLVGESGAGKTMTALGIMRLIPSGFGHVSQGSVQFEGRDLLALPFSEMRRVRGSEISMIFQDPMSSLNPVYAIGDQIAEAVRLHEGASRVVARRRALEMLDRVGIPEARQRMNQYPHQFSGGMRQRAMLAMALACRPKLLIADEPTTALDVTIQAQILDLLRSLRSEFGLAVLFVTHDLGVVADICDRVVVLYAGQLVEEAPLDRFFDRPRHPYSEGLLAAMPRMSARDEALYTIPGQVPVAGTAPPGCRFLPRCRHARDACHVAVDPDVVSLGSSEGGGRVRCVLHGDLELGGTS